MFTQRSSLASSFLTGIIGWIGFIVIGELAFSLGMSSITLLLMGLSCAVAQVSIMRALFLPLGMHRHVVVGAAWGLLLGALLYVACAYLKPVMWERPVAWLFVFTYIGAPVGAFLSYFHRDDQEYIAAAGGDARKANYSRDAHWLEPFGFGLVTYLIAFLPTASTDLFLKICIVGALSGVFAAGASHFSPDAWKRSWPLLFVIALFAGTVQGIASGWLVRHYTEHLSLSPFLHGAIGGVLTYVWTLIRGRQLSMRMKDTPH
jgi:hypothetical protein